ncbi:DUF397 domain-containing protein [Actinomadura sp. DC4]|nr:DUF397 domain-containing protein [Actinomadura sp. DC4]MDN3352947.1 DUF397 domain-containing protein [Actinomadura sp. DC4]
MIRPEWRKSSRSNSQGGDCVEIAEWRKSARSNSQGDDCAEVGQVV